MAWPDGGSNQVVKTIGTGEDYGTIAAWESDTDENCTTGWGVGDYASPCSPVGQCYDEDFNENPGMLGATESDDYYRTLTVAAGERHAGKPGDGAKVIGVGTPSLRDSRSIIEWLIFDGCTNLRAQYVPAAGKVGFRYIIVDNAADDAFQNYGSNATCELWWWDCQAINAGSEGFFGGNGTEYAYNCNVYSCSAYGFKGIPNCFNCVSIDCGYGSYYSCGGDYNIGSDETAPGAHSIDSVTVAIWESVTDGSEDFHLVSDSTAAAGAGIGPGSDANVLAADMDGDTRSGTTCDIGCDEYVVAATPLDIHYPLSTSWLQSIKRQNLLPVGWQQESILSALVDNDSLSIEWLQQLQDSKVIKVDWNSRLSSKKTLSASWLESFDNSYNLQSDWIQDLQAKYKIEAEFLQQSGLSKRLPISWQSEVAVSAVEFFKKLNIDWVQQLSIGDETQVEWVNVLDISSILNTDWTSIVEAASDSIQVEWSEILAMNHILDIDWIHQLEQVAKINIDWIHRTGDKFVHIPVSYLSGIKRINIVRADYQQGIRPDSIIPVSWQSTITQVEVFDSLPIEWSLTANSFEVFKSLPIDWSFISVPKVGGTWILDARGTLWIIDGSTNWILYDRSNIWELSSRE